MAYEIPNVWFAESAKFRSRFKWLTYNDRGTLVVAAEWFLLHGKLGMREFRQPRILGLERQPFPWPMLLLVDVIFALLLLMQWYIGADGLRFFYRADSPAAYLLLACYNLFFVFLNLRDRWIHIAYTDEAGRPEQAYFTEGWTFGGSRYFGGGARLLAQMIAGLESAPAGPTDSPMALLPATPQSGPDRPVSGGVTSRVGTAQGLLHSTPQDLFPAGS